MKTIAKLLILSISALAAVQVYAASKSKESTKSHREVAGVEKSPGV